MPRYFRYKSPAVSAGAQPSGTGPETWLMPLPVPFQDFVVNDAAVPAEAAAVLARPRSEAARLDFSLPVYEVISTFGGEKVMTVANWRHGPAEIIARFIHSRVGAVQPARESTTLVLISQLEDGRRLVTTDSSQEPDAPATTICQCLAGLAFGELLAAHKNRLEELRLSARPRIVADDDAMALLCDRIEIELLDHYVQSGLCELVDRAEVAAQPPPAESLPEIAPEDAAVLAEIDRLQNRKANWGNTVILAVVSLVIFIAIGGAQWDWEFASILAGVMVVHEAGHYVVMRIFKFKNLRMFFVPLLGAAVTGRHYNIKGWQNVLVSLAGPLPGIAAALVMMALPGGHATRLTENIILVSLLVNGINLLPVVPLDGGWVMNSILFCRHYVLETAFLGCAGIALIVASTLGWGQFWIYLGLAVLIGLPASFRLVRIAALLRNRGVSAASPDDQTVPPETALTILRELRQNQHIRRTDRQLANEVLSVFQKLNARPPGAAVSALLLAVYLGSGAAAFFGAKYSIQKRQRIYLGDFPGLHAPTNAAIVFRKINYPSTRRLA